jgi:hypothetical protein
LILGEFRGGRAHAAGRPLFQAATAGLCPMDRCCWAFPGCGEADTGAVPKIHRANDRRRRRLQTATDLFLAVTGRFFNQHREECGGRQGILIYNLDISVKPVFAMGAGRISHRLRPTVDTI